MEVVVEDSFVDMVIEKCSLPQELVKLATGKFSLVPSSRW